MNREEKQIFAENGQVRDMQHCLLKYTRINYEAFTEN